MFKYISLKEQVIKERNKNSAIEAETEKNGADIDYIAMMCDVNLDTAEEENDEQEV